MADSKQQEKVASAIEYAHTLVGTPFKWWIPGTPITKEDPFYVRAPEGYTYSKIYSKKYVKLHGVNSAGLINLIAHHVGVKPIGGVIMWMHVHISAIEMFDPNNSYPNGTILFREYKSNDDQGHMAMVVDDKTIIHAHPPSETPTEDLVYPGVCIEDWSISHEWIEDGFYDYALKPEDWIK